MGTKITSFTPSSITTGQKATMTGTGDLDEDVSGANFDLEMKTLAGKVSCKGDASQSKTCSLPLGVGSLTFNAMAFPIKKGTTSVSVDCLCLLCFQVLLHTRRRKSLRQLRVGTSSSAWTSRVRLLLTPLSLFELVPALPIDITRG